jgi:hypothetical protein
MGRQNATCFESALTTKDGLKFLDSTSIGAGFYYLHTQQRQKLA